MKTQPPTLADLRPRYVERKFSFHVASMPTAESPYYRLEVRCEDPEVPQIYTLYYRQGDFSLARVTRREPSVPEEALIQNSNTPFIYYERRIPLVPDFPIVLDSAKLAGHREFEKDGNRVSQDIELTAEGARITLEQKEAMGSLRVVMQWSAGDPWWSTIECTENPPPNSRLPGQVVAAGYLLKDSVVHDE